MLISYEHKFIFVHIYKTAGTSVEKALMHYCCSQPRLFLNKVLLHLFKGKIRINPQPYRKHISAKELALIYPDEIFKEFFKFAFVRNPWDWQVSLYTYTLKNKNHYQHEMVKKLGSFDSYIRQRAAKKPKNQLDWIQSNDGTMLVDYVGKFENLKNDFGSICNKIGIESTLPKVNVSNGKSYQGFYNEETRSLVETTYKRDIEYFNYKF